MEKPMHVLQTWASYILLSSILKFEHAKISKFPKEGAFLESIVVNYIPSINHYEDMNQAVATVIAWNPNKRLSGPLLMYHCDVHWDGPIIICPQSD